MSDLPTIEERYESSATSSNLRTQADKSGATDVLIAAGWSAARVGVALMRLHTKADRNTMEQVHAQLAIRAQGWNIEQPVAVAAAVLGWWLNKICGGCRGVKFSLIAGTPVLSNKTCKVCHGSGDKPLPFGESGKRMARFVEECIERGQASIRNRLHATRE